MKSGKSCFACVEPSVGNQSTAQMKSAERAAPSTVPATTNCTMRFIGAVPGHAARRGSYNPGRPPCRLSRRALVRFATVPPMAMSASARLAPIRTKFALPCAFAALITLVHSSDCGGGSRVPSPPVARAVFVTPAGNRADGARGGRRGRGHSGGLGRRPAQGRARGRRARRRAPLARRRGRRARRDLLGRCDRLAGRRAQRRRRAAARRARRRRASRSWCSTRPSAPRAGWTRSRARSCRRSTASTASRSTRPTGSPGATTTATAPATASS